MAINVTRNANGNCINFVNSSVPSYWNSCLHAEHNADNPDNINVINDIETIAQGTTKYEFFNVPYTDFADADGNAFADAAACVDYITTNANVVGDSGNLIFDPNDTQDFQRDETDTTILFENGAIYSVNSIVAEAADDGTITLKTRRGDKTLYTGLNHQNVTIVGASAGTSITGVVNALNALFTVSPEAAGGDYAPTYPTDLGTNATANLQEGTTPVTGTPTHLYTVGADTSSGHGARMWTDETITQSGEHFTVKMKGTGRFILGLVDTNNATDLAELSNNSGNGHSGLYWGNAFYNYGTYTAPWTTYGTSSGLSYGPGWNGATSTQMRYNTVVQGNLRDDMNDGTYVTFRVGIDNQGYISVWYYDEGRSNEYILTARRSATTPAGEYALVVKLWDGNATLVEAPKIFTQPADSTVTVGSTDISLFGGAAGDITGSGVTVASAANNRDGFVTTQTLTSPGEYFELTGITSNEEYGIGLSYDVDQDASAIQTDFNTNTYAGVPEKNYFLGVRIKTNDAADRYVSYRDDTGTSYGTVTGSGNNVASRTHWRVGLDLEGRPCIWSSADGTTFNVVRRMTSAAPAGSYRLLWKGFTSGASINTVTTGQLSSVPALAWRYIESPDGSFHWPLFASTEEAVYVAENIETLLPNGGYTDAGLGTYSTRQYVDDPNLGMWYMPDNVQNINAASAPTDTASVSFVEIPTLADAQFAPSAFTFNDVTIDEGDALNLQVTPADAAFTTTFTVSPAWAGLQLGISNLQGTAPQVDNDYAVNPSDDYTITITRTNNYGSTSSSFTVTVNNLTAPTSSVSGITALTGDYPGWVDGDTLDEGSAASFDDTLEAAHRYIFNKAWVETNVLPALQESGDTVYVGILEAGGDLTITGSGASDADFKAFVSWSYDSATSHLSTIGVDGAATSSVVVNSTTDAVYDYAFEADDHGDLYVIACNVNAINTEPGLDYGGSFTRTAETTGTAPFTINMATVGTQMDASVTGVGDIVIPAAPNWIQVTHTGGHTLNFDGSGTMPTLNAGYTYRFLMADVTWADQTTSTSLSAADILKFTADGTTEYTTGITRSGAVGSSFAYVEFAVPADVPPLEWYNDQAGIGGATGVSISGSTHVTPVTGVTQEGPGANQTGNNLFDANDHGWISIDEQLGAGERLVMSTAFLADLVDAMPDGSSIKIGLKDSGWASTTADTNFEGSLRFVIERNSSTDVDFRAWSGASSTALITTTVAGITSNNIAAALELTNSGNNIRFAIRSDATNNSDVNTTTAYADWNSSYKVQTGDQGYGLTSVDIMILGNDVTASAAMNTADVTWTNLSEISVPTPASTLTTNWTKALDFSGSSERTQMVNSSYLYNPLRMSGISANVVGNATAGYTSNDTDARPWATVCVFNSDRNSSNQHIWNMGEGAGSTDDNIYLRHDASGRIYFGWGRSGEINEIYLGFTASANTWYGLYIASTGERVSSGDATPAGLADCFDIRLVNLSSGAVGSNLSTSTNWSNSLSTTGGRMNRQFTGNMTIGGRGSNRNFHGKVAAMVVTTLRRNVAMPTDAEISMMVRDPLQWLTDYKVGNSFRRPPVGTDTANFQFNSLDSSYGTQVWLMGDGTSDAYAQIRNQVYPATQNNTPMNMVSMVSNDIQTVSITGLT